MRLWTVPLVIMVLVHLCRAVDLTYSVDPSRLPGNKSTCKFSWANGNDVLATDLNQTAQVMKRSLDSLQTFKCFAEVNLKAHCTSEKTGFLDDFTANCTSSCEQRELLLEDKGGHSALWTLLILAVLPLGYLLYKCRKKISSGSTPSCSQFGGLYTGIQTQNTHTEPEGVMVEN